MQHFVTVDNLDEKQVLALIKRAQYFKQGGRPTCDPKRGFCVNMFFEDSTRTHTSFEMAERKLGLNVLQFDPKQSSVNKGQRLLYDTLLTMDALGVKLAVIRHSQNEYYATIDRTRVLNKR